MSKNLLIAIVIVVVLATGFYLKMQNDSSIMVPSSSATSSTVTYTCDGNKSFALHYVDGTTTRVDGAGVTTTSLKENAAGYLVSVDGKTSVKTVGTYVVLVQKDLVTHDRCHVK